MHWWRPQWEALYNSKRTAELRQYGKPCTHSPSRPNHRTFRNPVFDCSIVAICDKIVRASYLTVGPRSVGNKPAVHGMLWINIHQRRVSRDTIITTIVCVPGHRKACQPRRGDYCGAIIQVFDCHNRLSGISNILSAASSSP